jgi:AcrR family transcriptional regulator
MLDQMPRKPGEDGKSRRATLSRDKARQALLKASAELFLETGVEQFSLRQAAERAGQSPGNVYNYFKDKEDLLRSLAQEAVVRFNQAQSQALQGIDDPLERYFTLGRSYVEFGIEHRAWYRLLQRTDLLMGRLDPHESAEPQNSFDLLVGTLQEGMDKGLIRPQPLLPLAAFSWAVVHGIVDLFHGPLAQEPGLLPEMLNAMNDSLAQGILTTTNPPSPQPRKKTS